jgi:hypothetical protein
MTSDHHHSHDAHSHSHPSRPLPPPSSARKQATVVASFDRYKSVSLSLNQRRRQAYYALSPAHQALLPHHPTFLAEVDVRIRVNATLVERFVENEYYGRIVNDAGEEVEGGEVALAPTSADHEVSCSLSASLR